MKSRPVIHLVAALLIGAVFVTLSLLEWWPALWGAVAVMLAAVIALQIDNRSALSARVFSVGRKLERIVRAATPASDAKSKHTVDNAPTAAVKATTTAAKADQWAPESAATDTPSTAAPQGKQVASGPSPKTAPKPAAKGSPARPSQKPADPVDLIVRSGVFDLELYSLQLSFQFPDVTSAVKHYLRRGNKSGFLPHALFLPCLVDPDWNKKDTDPLVRYLSDLEFARVTPTHPLFDPGTLNLASIPADESPLAWFLRNADSSTPLPSPEGALHVERSVAEVRDAVMKDFVELRQVHRNFDPLRGASEPPAMDPDLHAKVLSFQRTTRRPLVSVVLPTWNRGKMIRAAIESVRQQSYTEWELLVADDGSIDDTALIVESVAARDERVRLLRLPRRGVSATRNSALAAARGEYIAFLDSDKEWDRQFLFTMLAVLEQDRIDAAVAACAVSRGEKVIYRTVQPTRASLAIGNSVDQTAIVARKSLIDATGGFDESLRRAVDYDLVLKIAEHTTLHQVPYVGIRYSEDDSDPNRISEFESKAWNYHVSDRHAWKTFRSEQSKRELRDDLVTVVVDDVRSLADARAHVEWLSTQQTEELAIEVILVPHRGSWALRAALGTLSLAKLPVRVLTTGFRVDRPWHVNAALRMAEGSRIVIFEARQRVLKGRLDEFLKQLEGAAAVHPVVVGSTLLIENAGAIYPEFGADPVEFLRGMPTDVLHGLGRLPVPAAPLPLAARTSVVHAVEGMTALLDHLYADVELSQKLARASESEVVVATSLTVQQGGPIWTARTGNSPDDLRTMKQLWNTPPTNSRRALEMTGVEPVFNGFTALSFPTDPKRWSDAILAPRLSATVDRSRPLRIAIRTAAPADDRAANWGDFHYAQALADAFRRLGQQAAVDFQPNAERATSGFDDVVINLRGLRDVAIPSNATSVIWVLSHPDQVTVKEVEKYDLAYAASMSWAAQQSEQWGVPISPLLQCTDPNRFSSDVLPEYSVAGSIIMVGNSRRQFRPAAWHAANAGYPVKIWGTHWEGMVPDEAIVAESLPNESVPAFYRSAKWTLNDHWSDMRDDGFISNRIFDVLAAGGRLITDDVRGLEEVFGDRLAVFHSPVELFQLLDQDPDLVYPAELRKELAREVRELHSFDARAAQLLEDVRTNRARRSANW